MCVCVWVRVRVCACVRVCVCVCVCECVSSDYVGLLSFPTNIVIDFFLIHHLKDVILNYAFFVEIPWIQFSCLLLILFLSSSLLLTSFCCCLSFFFNLKKTLSVENACLFFSSFVVHWWVHFPSSFPHMSTSPAVTCFFLTRDFVRAENDFHISVRIRQE